MSPELAACGNSVSQRAVSCAFIQSPISVWLSPRAALKRAYPNAAHRSMQASPTSRWMVVNSNEIACTACDRPDSASASKPSTSILMNAGTPCLAINPSSVVTATSRVSLQRCVCQPGAPCADSTKAGEIDDTVGLSTLINMRVLPGSRPTANASIATDLL